MSPRHTSCRRGVAPLVILGIAAIIGATAIGLKGCNQPTTIEQNNTLILALVDASGNVTTTQVGPDGLPIPGKNPSAPGSSVTTGSSGATDPTTPAGQIPGDAAEKPGDSAAAPGATENGNSGPSQGTDSGNANGSSSTASSGETGEGNENASTTGASGNSNASQPVTGDAGGQQPGDGLVDGTVKPVPVTEDQPPSDEHASVPRAARALRGAPALTVEARGRAA